jgi:hypothetical protein
MKNKNEPIPAGGMTLCVMVIFCTIMMRDAFILQKGLPWLVLCCLPLLIIALKDILDKMAPAKWHLPDLARLRYYIESVFNKVK